MVETEEVHKANSFDLTSRIAPGGEPYTHVLIHTADGTRELLEVHPDELRLAELEIFAAILEKRASYVVLHPLNRDGAEHHYPGTIAGMVKMHANLAQQVVKANLEAEEQAQAARMLGIGGPVGRRR